MLGSDTTAADAMDSTNMDMDMDMDMGLALGAAAERGANTARNFALLSHPYSETISACVRLRWSADAQHAAAVDIEEGALSKLPEENGAMEMLEGQVLSTRGLGPRATRGKRFCGNAPPNAFVPRDNTPVPRRASSQCLSCCTWALQELAGSQAVCFAPMPARARTPTLYSAIAQSSFPLLASAAGRPYRRPP